MFTSRSIASIRAKWKWKQEIGHCTSNAWALMSLWTLESYLHVEDGNTGFSKQLIYIQGAFKEDSSRNTEHKHSSSAETNIQHIGSLQSCMLWWYTTRNVGDIDLKKMKLYTINFPIHEPSKAAFESFLGAVEKIPSASTSGKEWLICSVPQAYQWMTSNATNQLPLWLFVTCYIPTLWTEIYL